MYLHQNLTEPKIWKTEILFETQRAIPITKCILRKWKIIIRSNSIQYALKRMYRAHLSPFWHATIISASLGNFSTTLGKNELLKRGKKWINKIYAHRKREKNKKIMVYDTSYLSKDSVGMPLHQPPVQNIELNVIEFQRNWVIDCIGVTKEPARIF
jgi:hypothetical protein